MNKHTGPVHEPASLVSASEDSDFDNGHGGPIPNDLGDDLGQLEQIEDDLGFGARWAELDALHPGHVSLWTVRAQRLVRRKQFDEAIEFIAKRQVEDLDDDGLALKAGLLYDARAFDQARTIFDRLIEKFPDRRDIRLAYAKRLFTDGHLTRAH